MFMQIVISSFERSSVRYALVGGYAVAMHGALRGTVDVDFILEWDLDNLKKAVQILESLSLQSRIPLKAEEVYEFKDEYIEKRNLIAWGFINPGNPTEQVDLVITHDLRDMKTQRLKKPFPLTILTIDDLISMKRDGGRPQDIADIQALEKIKGS